MELKDQLLCAQDIQRSFDIVCEIHQRNFTGNVLQATQEQCSIAPDFLNGADDVFDDGLPVFDDVCLPGKTFLESVQDRFVFPAVHISPAW